MDAESGNASLRSDPLRARVATAVFTTLQERMGATPTIPEWWPTLACLPGLRLRCRIRVAKRLPLPNAGEIRGAIGRCLMASGNTEVLACLFPSVRDDEPQGPFGHATPWAVHRTEEGLLELGLFADSPPHLIDIVQALMAAGRGRIGMHENVVFEGFEHQEELIEGDWRPGLPVRLGRWLPPPKGSADYALRLLSPLRIRRRGQDLGPSTLQPRDVLAQLMRRVTGLLQQAGMPPPGWDARALLAAIDGRPFQHCELRVTSLDRFSSRQDQAMRLHGLLGRIQLSPDVVEAFWPLLWMGQALHVGKTPCLGMGRYRMVVIEDH